MTNTDVLQNFQTINIESPVDKIIRQVRSLITSGQLKQGERLPSERKLADAFGVGRGSVRMAIQKLEFYGILRTMPQSGTVVAGMGMTALEGLISDVLKIENSDFTSLVETRVLMETEAARMAARKRTEKDIQQIRKAMHACNLKTQQGASAVEEDLMFHLKIAEASKNSVLKSLMLIITPDIIRNFIQLDVCENGRSINSSEEHEIIVEHIIAQNEEAAAAAMRAHLKDVLEFSKNLKNGFHG